jgi:hypothetical protein
MLNSPVISISVLWPCRSAAAFGISQVILIGVKHKGRLSSIKIVLTICYLFPHDPLLSMCSTAGRQDQAAISPVYYRQHFVRVPWWRVDVSLLNQAYADSRITFVRYDTLSECHLALKEEGFHTIGVEIGGNSVDITRSLSLLYL